MNIPKYLVEIEPESVNFIPSVPTRSVWVARTREPFALGLVTIHESSLIEFHLWPAVIDADAERRRKLIDGMTRAIFREYDLYPGDWAAPKYRGLAPEPPEFLHVIRPESNFEMILEPHAPRLWKVLLAGDDAIGAEWVRGWGAEPEFPASTRRVTEFLQTI